MRLCGQELFMTTAPDLWTIRLTCESSQVEALEAVFEGEALALSSFAPPRESLAQIDVLTEGKPNKSDVDARLILWAAMGKQKAVRAEIYPVGNLDWIKKVAQDFPPLDIARWRVFGANHKKVAGPTRMGLQIDATSAFGTGEHPTTKGCMILLDEYLKSQKNPSHLKLLDMGCGSGILAMAFARATHGFALGIDMDAPSIGIARENARINGLAKYLSFDVGCGYGPRSVAKHAPYDLVMANIFARPLCEMAKDLKGVIKTGGYVILSGILNAQANAVISAHRSQGLVLKKRLRLGEWSALALYAPVGAS
jgi:ribosomal protein L11 methyltransferase